MLLLKMLLLVPLALYGAMLGLALTRTATWLLPVAYKELNPFSVLGVVIGALAAMITAAVFANDPPTRDCIGCIMGNSLIGASVASLFVPSAMVIFFIFKWALTLTGKGIDKIFERR